MIFRALFFIFVFIPVHARRHPDPVRDHAARPAVLERAAAHLPQGRLHLPRHAGEADRHAGARPADAARSPTTSRWTDIIAIGSVADVTFVAKSEVANWFFVGFMAIAAAHHLRRPQPPHATPSAPAARWRSAHGGGQRRAAVRRGPVAISARTSCRSARRWSAPPSTRWSEARRQGRRDPAADHRLHQAAGPAGQPLRAQR